MTSNAFTSVSGDSRLEPAGKPGFSRRTLLTGAGLGLGAIGISALLAACSPQGSAQSGGGTPTAGGILRVGAVGAGTVETLNPYAQSAPVDIARTSQVYQRLIAFTGDGKIENVLAESFTPNADGKTWVVKLRTGVVWHDGKPFTADDVIYSINYMIDNKTLASSSMSDIDQTGLSKVDANTVSVKLKAPNFMWPERLISIYPVIIQNGTTSFDTPVGTGPFQFVSWTQGTEATYKRNENYWKEKPYLDRVKILSIADSTARTSALQSGQLDVAVDIPSVSAATIRSISSLQLLNSPAATAPILYMLTDDSGPVGDPRVRQAIKYLFKRDQVVSNAYGGSAKIGNDLTSWFDKNYASEIPQREFDPDKAKRLLSQAGYANAALTIEVADLIPGQVDTATLLSESAKEAGLTINVHKTTSTEYLASYYYKPTTPIGVTYWTGRTVAAQIADSMLPGSFNESHFNNATFNSAYAAAITSSDPAVQRKNLVDCQQILYTDGGFLIPAFGNALNAATSRVHDLPESVPANFGYYNFERVWISA